MKSGPHLDLGPIGLGLALVLKERGALPPGLSIVGKLEQKLEELLLAGLLLAEGETAANVVHFCRLRELRGLVGHPADFLLAGIEGGRLHFWNLGHLGLGADCLNLLQGGVGVGLGKGTELTMGLVRIRY